MLRLRCPEFAALPARKAQNKARQVARRLKERGKQIFLTPPPSSTNERPRRRRSTVRVSTSLGLKQRRDLAYLKKMYTAYDKNWIIDTEFQPLIAGKSPVPFSISIRNFHGHLVFESLVDYGGISMHDLYQQLAPYLTKPHTLSDGVNIARRNFEHRFLRHYHCTNTHGMNIESIRTILVQQGYWNIDHVLSWFSPSDLFVLNHVMTADNSPVVDVIRSHLCISLPTLCRGMIYPPLKSSNLEDVHKRICPWSRVRKYHDASNDSLALAEIIRVLVRARE